MNIQQVGSYLSSAGNQTSILFDELTDEEKRELIKLAEAVKRILDSAGRRHSSSTV